MCYVGNINLFKRNGYKFNLFLNMILKTMNNRNALNI